MIVRHKAKITRACDACKPAQACLNTPSVVGSSSRTCQGCAANWGGVLQAEVPSWCPALLAARMRFVIITWPRPYTSSTCLTMHEQYCTTAQHGARSNSQDVNNDSTVTVTAHAAAVLLEYKACCFKTGCQTGPALCPYCALKYACNAVCMAPQTHCQWQTTGQHRFLRKTRCKYSRSSCRLLRVDQTAPGHKPA